VNQVKKDCNFCAVSLAPYVLLIKNDELNGENYLANVESNYR
jgi:hypothetical protein